MHDDTNTTLQSLKDAALQIAQERDWTQFHSPKNLSMYIAIEAAELMELFAWVDNDTSRETAQARRNMVEQELADIMITCLMFANSTGIDISQAIAAKMDEVRKKYPIEKAKGKSNKYTEL